MFVLACVNPLNSCLVRYSLFCFQVLKMPQKSGLVLLVCFAMSFSSLVLPGCKRSHVNSVQQFSRLIILHIPDVNGEQFVSQNPEFGLSNPQRISRSENKWQYEWKVEAARRERILLEIKNHTIADNNVPTANASFA